MKPSRKRVMTTIIMMAVAMIGLTIVQAQLLRHAWQLKEQAFDRHVGAALSQTAQQLETVEVVEEARMIIRGNFPENLTQASVAIGHLEVDSLGSEFFSREKPHTRISVGDGRSMMVMQALDDLLAPSRRPVSERTSTTEIDSLLEMNLGHLGRGVERRFVVVSVPGDSVVLAGPMHAGPIHTEAIRPDSPYRTTLFHLDFFSPKLELLVWFPGRTGFLLNQLWPLVLASLVFMIVVVVSFWLNLQTIAGQRRASASMIDFVNNMTHEFKTPISTVTLASEAIGGREFQDLPEALRRYNGMIRQETRRMSRHVETILQFAHLEEGDFHLNLEEVSLHEVIRDVCSSFQLVVEEKGGTLQLDLHAREDLMSGDPVNLANIVSNLVDNAVKYSSGGPLVQVSTHTSPGWLILQVADQGIGISKADRDRVFDRFFRCSTGDRHDVKGFGLGLSYVRLLVDAHQGRIELKSNPGQGTTIRILFPCGTKEAPLG